MTGDDFISLAGRLSVFANADESVLRTATSRAYYGAFHLAREFLEDVGFAAPRNADVHNFVQRHLIGSGHAAATLAGSHLSDLQRHRNRADYQLGDTHWTTPELTQQCVERTHAIRSALDSCHNEAAQAAIAHGIRLYQARLKK